MLIKSEKAGAKWFGLDRCQGCPDQVVNRPSRSATAWSVEKLKSEAKGKAVNSSESKLRQRQCLCAGAANEAGLEHVNKRR